MHVSERSVKAAFLYKFASYVQWPDVDAKTDAPITIGVIGATDFARELAEITANRTINSRRINVRRLTMGTSLDDLEILFIAKEEGDHLPQLLSAARDKPILTVTESDGALSSGSIINFTVDQDRVRFEISLYAAEKSQLRLSARLLAVAQGVHRGPEPGQ
ncbi:MAG: YfiR family protein [Gammaproteobacteria bacterium]